MRAGKSYLALAAVLFLINCDLTSSTVSKERPSFATFAKIGRDHPEEFTAAITEFLNSLSALGGLISQLVLEQLAFLTEAIKELSQNPPSVDITQMATCTLCTTLVTALNAGFKVNYAIVETALIQLCVTVQKIQDPSTNRDEQCNFLKIQGPEISKSILAADLLGLFGPSFYTICAFQNACYKQPSRNSVLMAPRCNDKPQPTEEDFEKLEAAKEEAFVIAHITDIHIELDYATGSNADCGMFVCCLERLGAGDAKEFGDYRCNVPQRTLEIALAKFAQLNADMYIFSGDVPPHRAWNETEESQHKCIETIAEIMQKALPDKIIMTTIGNHDNYPTNLFSVEHMTFTPRMLDLYVDKWSVLNDFGPDQVKTIKSGGYYTMKRPFGTKEIRIIAINSNYGYTLNVYNPLNHRGQGEAKVMKDDIENIIENACTNNEMVLLIIHQSIGDADFVNTEAIYWQNLIAEYSTCIKLILSGHSHIDEFRVIKDADNAPKSLVYIAGSVDTSNYRNPSIRRYFLDRNTAEVLDYEVQYLDINNVPVTDDPQMKLLYSARREYNLIDMSPASFEDLACRFGSDPVMAEKHLNHGTSNAVTNDGACNADCIKDHQCRQTHAVYSHYVTCSGIAQDFYFYGLSIAKLPHIII